MKKSFSFLAATVAMWSAVACGAATTNTVAGAWNGTLEAGGIKLRRVFKISTGAGGALSAKMDSLDQGATGIPLSAITLKDGKVRFEARGIGGVYEGTFSPDGSTLKGRWQQGGQSLPLEFTKAAAN